MTHRKKNIIIYIKKFNLEKNIYRSSTKKKKKKTFVLLKHTELPYFECFEFSVFFGNKNGKTRFLNENTENPQKIKV